MTDDTEKASGKAIGEKGLTVGKVFWAVLFFMAAATLALALVATLRPAEEPVPGEDLSSDEPPVVEAPPDYPRARLRAILEEAATTGSSDAQETLHQGIDDLYAPVYGGIEEYADFHYSVLGEYIELSSAAMGRMEQVIQDRLFDGFEGRLEELATDVDGAFESSYVEEVTRALDELPEGATFEGVPPGRIAADAQGRLKTTVPVASAAVALGGVAALKVSSKAMAKRIAMTVAGKAAAKGVAKSSGAMGGAGAGAAGGALVGGPVGALVGGAAGAVATWLLVDHVVIKIDEFYNREEFEAELAAMVDEHKNMVVSRLEEAIAERRAQLSDFTLAELADEEGAEAAE